MARYPLHYVWMDLVFRVERVEGSTRWIGIGRRTGRRPYPLDKLGDADDEDAMQAKLDAWAKRQGLKPCNLPTSDERQLALGI